MSASEPSSGKSMLLQALGGLPRIKTVAGKMYCATLIQILSWDEHNRPKDTRVLQDDESIHLNGGEHFMIAYIPKDYTVRRETV